MKAAQKEERATFLRANQPGITTPLPNGGTRKRRIPEQIEQIHAMFARQKQEWQQLIEKFSKDQMQIELDKTIKSTQEDLDLRRAARRERFITLRNTPSSSSTPE